MSLLLHACCGPCLTYSSAELGKKFSKLTVYSFNPNIYPAEEHTRRRTTLLEYARARSLETITADDNADYFYQAIASEKDNGRSGALLAPEQYSVHLRAGISKLLRADNNDAIPKGRCARCYLLRLSATAYEAKVRGDSAFSTTLLISPYQEHETLRRMGEMVGTAFDVEFFYKDLREGFKASQTLSRELNMYRQNYCGCKFSLSERFEAK